MKLIEIIEMIDQEETPRLLKLSELCNFPEKKLRFHIKDESNGDYRVQNARPASKGYLNISKATLFRWINEGKFLAFSIDCDFCKRWALSFYLLGIFRHILKALKLKALSAPLICTISLFTIIFFKLNLITQA